jgi:hypothetical protein
LIDEIAGRSPHFIALSRLLSDRAFRVGRLREWLSSAPAYGKLRADDIETISNDPPLPLFILFEAMQELGAEGLRLGPLGSIIVAEVVFSALERGRLSLGCGADTLAGRLAEISRNYYAGNVFAEIPNIATMAQLVEATAEIADLMQAVPAFL